jgi:signal transduction histidine kinase
MVVREDICARMRRWPRNVVLEHRVVAQECVEYCRQLFASRRVVLALEQGDEPWLTLAVADDAGFTWREEVEGDFWPIVAPELEESSFFVQPVSRRVVLACNDSELPVSEPIAGELRRELGADDGLVSAPVRSEHVQGRIFACAPEVDAASLLHLAEAVGLMVATRLEASVHCATIMHEAVEQERVRVARDLHDGLLQSFTGVVLQLETVHSTLESRPDEARRMITEMQATIMADQRELRHFVEQLRPRAARREAAFDFAARLDDLRSRFDQQWGVKLAFDVERVDPSISPFIGQETFRLIHEAVTNSAKHGAASNVRVEVRTAGSEMHIEVADNGTGFAFRGRLTLAEMKAQGSGPMILAERVESLNGSLVVDSTESGATVTMSVPLGWGAS